MIATAVSGRDHSASVSWITWLHTMFRPYYENFTHRVHTHRANAPKYARHADGKEETQMKRIFAVAIVAANLAFTASAARAEGNGYHQQFYPASSKTIQTVSPAATAVGTVTGPGFSPCAYCAFREDNMGR